MKIFMGIVVVLVCMWYPRVLLDLLVGGSLILLVKAVF